MSTQQKNRLRYLINEGEPTLSTGVIIPWPGVVEIIGNTKIFDYVEIAGEYMSWDLHDLDNISRAVELYEMSSMMKVDQNNRGFIAQRALGAGIQNMLFADIRTAEDVKECVRIVRPETQQSKGLNGCHMRRNVGYTKEGASPAYVQAMNDSVIALMIEKKEAIDNLDEILSVDGIDMIQFGPGDLSMSLGIPGQFSHPNIKSIEMEVIKTAIEKGKRPRVELSSTYNIDNIQEYIQLGVKDFRLSMDVVILDFWLTENGKILTEILKNIKT